VDFSFLTHAAESLNELRSGLLLKSIVIASAVGILSTVFGILIGFLIYKTDLRYRNFFKIALLIPLFISPYIWAVAWKDLFFLLVGNTDFIYSDYGVVLVLTTVFTPLSFLIIGSALLNIDSALEESGLMITEFKNVLIKITLPLIKPAVYGSFILVFIFSISEFSVPAFLGVEVFTTEIFKQFSAFYNHSVAILQSLLLVVICVLLLLSERKYLSGAPFLSIGNKGTKSKIYRFGTGNYYGILFLAVWFVVTSLLPVAVLTVQSFHKGTEFIFKANEMLGSTFAVSFGLAASGAMLIVFIGFAGAFYSLVKRESALKKAFDWSLLITFAIPSIILGISLIKFYNRPYLNFIYSSLGIIIIGYTGKFSFISYKIIENSLRQIPPAFLESARLQGIKPFSQVKNIILPLILPSILASFVIGFVFSIEELGMTIMLYPPGSEILPIKVFTLMANAPKELTASMTLIVFSITLFTLLIFYFLIGFLIRRNKFYDDRI